jgi:hypothetical protein
MKDDMNDEVPNGIPKILIPFVGVKNYDGVSKSSSKLEGTMLHIYEIKLKIYHTKFSLEMFIYK